MPIQGVYGRMRWWCSFPKGTTPVEDLRKFRPLFEQRNHLIVASRQITGSVNEEDGGTGGALANGRFGGWASWPCVVWRRDGYWIRDVLQGFKGFTREAFARMKILDHGLSIDIEMVVRSYKLRTQAVRVPHYRKAPRARHELTSSSGPPGGNCFAYLWFELCRPCLRDPLSDRKGGRIVSSTHAPGSGNIRSTLHGPARARARTFWAWTRSGLIRNACS
jgi:hypothetical protein